MSVIKKKVIKLPPAPPKLVRGNAIYVIETSSRPNK